VRLSKTTWKPKMAALKAIIIYTNEVTGFLQQDEITEKRNKSPMEQNE